MKWASRSDSELAALCLEGHQEAWKAIVDRYSKLVYTLPLKYHLTAEEAADISQEVWLDLFNELPKLRKTESLRYWLATATVRRCLRRKQRAARTQELDIDPETNDPALDAALEAAEREQVLREAVASLPPRCQEMIRLLFYHEPPLSYKEVAERLGLAEGSIGFIRGRCLRKLEAALEERGF